MDTFLTKIEWGGVEYIKYLINAKILGKPKYLYKRKLKIINTFKHLYRGFVHNIIFHEHYKKVVLSTQFNDFFNEIYDHKLKSMDEVLFNTTLCNLIEKEYLSTTYEFLYTDWTGQLYKGSPLFLYKDKLEEYFKQNKEKLYFFIRKIPDVESLEYIDSIIDK